MTMPTPGRNPGGMVKGLARLGTRGFLATARHEPKGSSLLTQVC